VGVEQPDVRVPEGVASRGQRAAGVDRAARVLDDDDVEPRQPRVERAPRNAEVRGQSAQPDPARAAFAQQAGEPGVRAAVRLDYSTALTMSSTTFFASPNTIIVLSM
jgi:hypothetical protein